MKNILFVSFFAVLLVFSSSAYSEEGPYMSGNIGFAMLSDSDLTDSTVPGITLDMEFDRGLALGFAAGYDFGETRIEGEIAYQKNDFDKASLLGVGVNLSGDTSSLALMLNGYYDFHNESKFTPFITGGLGFAKVEINDLNVPGSGIPDTNDDDTVLAYQVGAGVGYALNAQVTLDLTYRYFATSDPEFDTAEAEFASHNILLGARFKY